ncbi:hypothetical protein RFI_19846 [Reticulomyxa filosa]|uniref:SAM domain-containing protein n=1 Tax=Reticulomyxa filosa TaxID=46433 RepID=X6MVK3_RETFI|nr:hypothetical protein RFI_19846 [Reticulomyxa filosa]|eukprot:ETO17477.1 hypothetical protein RFI_19846 [Reticulomyxa filosa]
MEQVTKIQEEEKKIGQTYEKRLAFLKMKLSRKIAIQNQLRNWELFLNHWKDWNIEDFHSYVVRIHENLFAKYFSSAEELRNRWNKDHSTPFQGGLDLISLDREDLLNLGVDDKDHRKLLLEAIRSLCKQ